MTAFLWFLLVTAGAAAVGFFIFYGQRKTAQPEPIEAVARRDAATREIYRREDRVDR
jgi:hypothetical protein